MDTEKINYVYMLSTMEELARVNLLWQSPYISKGYTFVSTWLDPIEMLNMGGEL